MDPYLRTMAIRYLLTVAIELPMLLIFLSRRYSIKHRVFAGFWLTACTYPILWLVLPRLIDPIENRAMYLAVGETFVPIAECFLFWIAFGKTQPRSRGATIRDCATIVIANLLSFGLGELFHRTVGWDWLL